MLGQCSGIEELAVPFLVFSAVDSSNLYPHRSFGRGFIFFAQPGAIPAESIFAAIKRQERVRDGRLDLSFLKPNTRVTQPRVHWAPRPTCPERGAQGYSSPECYFVKSG